jgi:hypothetical protein
MPKANINVAQTRRITYEYHAYAGARERDQGQKAAYRQATTRMYYSCHYRWHIHNSNSPNPAVIMNEHLMEALRRLRRNSTETNVDRRLVTNVLLAFLSTPRADSKRFEMLTLLASILSWSDQEREKAGLQRVNPSEPAHGGTFWGRSISTSGARHAEVEKSDETEVRFLIIKSCVLADLPCSSF